MSDCLVGLTADQRKGAFILSAVDTLQTQVNAVQASVVTLDDETFHDDANYNYVSSTASMAYDPTKQFNTLVGVDGGCIGDGNSEGTTILGSRARVQNGDYNIAIGANANILYTGVDPDHRVNKNIVIGTNSYIRNPADAAEVNANINIGHDNEIDNGTHNIVVGNAVNHGGQIANTVIFAQKPIKANVRNPSNGSVVISASPTGGDPSVLPRLSFLSDGLTRLQGDAFNNQFPNAGFAIGNINGYMRINYQGKNLLIPVLSDPNDATEAPAY